MKIISGKEMMRLERLAYEKEGLHLSEAFMENAGKKIAELVHHLCRGKLSYNRQKPIYLLCAKGNNSGDAYVAGRYLVHYSYEVIALQTTPLSLSTELTKKNHDKFVNSQGKVLSWSEGKDYLQEDVVVIDGLFGTGFSGALKEPFIGVVEKVRASKAYVISLDVPSGLDSNVGSENKDQVIAARHTISLGLPKTGCFLERGLDVAGTLHCVDFGLSQKYTAEAQADFELFDSSMAKAWFPVIKTAQHKYEAGCVIGVAGSLGMGGAAILSACGALRGGAGLLKLLCPKEVLPEIYAGPPEVIKISYDLENFHNSSSKIDFINDVIAQGDACYLGPGLGRSASTFKFIKTLLSKLSKVDMPTVLDADALNLYAEESFDLPSMTVMTPHLKEMQRLLGLNEKPSFSKKFLASCQNYVENKKVTLVLKGAPTFVLHPGTIPYCVPYGSPGMATAGSGDVLTGVIAALLARKLSPLRASVLGVYLHQKAGEKAAQERSNYGMLASDLIEGLSKVFCEEFFS